MSITTLQYATAEAALQAQFKAGQITEAQLASAHFDLLQQWVVSNSDLADRVVSLVSALDVIITDGSPDAGLGIIGGMAFDKTNFAIYGPKTGNGWGGPQYLAGVTWAAIGGKPSTFPPEAHVHAAADITSGTFLDARIPNLNAGKTTAGVFADARIPGLDAGKIQTGMFANDRISEASVTQHLNAIAAAITLEIASITGLQIALDAKLAAALKGAANGVAELGMDLKVPVAQIPSLPASQTGSGEFADAQISVSSVTQHQGSLTLTRSQISDAGSLAGKNTIGSPDIDSAAVTEDKLSAAVAEKLNRSAKNNFSAITDPAVTDDTSGGYSEGSRWLNTVTDESYVCVDPSVGTAIWLNTSLTADELGSMSFQEATNVNIGGGVAVLSSAAIGGVAISGGNVDGRNVSVDGTKLDGIETGATADQSAAEIRDAYESNVGINRFTDAEKTKLGGIETGATVNDTDANLLNRANHTGTQPISTVTGLQIELDSKIEMSGLPFASIIEYTSTDIVTDMAATGGAVVQWNTPRITDSAISIGGVNNTDITFAANGRYRIAARISYEDTSAEDSNVNNSLGLFLKLNGTGTGGQGVGSVVMNTAGANEGQVWFEQVVDITDFQNQAITVCTQRLSGADSLYLRSGESALIVERVGGKSALLAAQQISDIGGLQNALDAKLDDTQKGAAGGLAELDGGGKVPTAQLPDAVLGTLKYQGVWNADTNTPIIPAAASGNVGHYYRVSVAGSTDIDGTTDWEPGDWLVSNGTVWDKIDNSEAVTSVAGKSGDVALVKADVGLGNADNTADADKPVSTAQQTALDAKQSISDKGSANGYASLDAGGKVPVAQIPDGVGGLVGKTVTGTGALVAGESVVVDASGGTADRSLPASLVDGDQFVVKARGGSVRITQNTNTIRFKGVAIGGDLLLADGETASLQADSTSTAEIM